MSDRDPGEPDVGMLEPARGGMSVIWLVPLVAIGVSLFMAWQAFSDRGPLIEVVFESAEGVVAGETELKFRDVTIGTVEDVRFTEALTEVILSVRIDKDMAQYVDSDAQFWIVRPEVSAQGISGLGTLLGGVHVEATWDDTPGTPLARFEGLAQPPFITGNMRGVEFTLAASSGGTIAPGAPLIYKGVSVGLIDRPRLNADGSAVTARAFVQAPYDRLITDATRFWGVSGFSLDLGTDGLSVGVANLTSLIQGGIAFETFGDPGAPVGPDRVFTVYQSRNDAGSLNITQLDGPEVPFSVLLSNSIQGLSPGAPVRYRGLTIGSVTGTGAVVRDSPEGPQVLLRADIGIAADRLDISGEDVTGQTEALFENLVERGLRARLASSGLLGTSREIQLVDVPDAPPAEITRTSGNRPILPNTAPVVTDAAETARSAFARIEDIPIERIAASVADLLDGITTVVTSDGVQAAPEQITGLARDLRGVVTGGAVQDVLETSRAAAGRIDTLLAQLEEGGAAQRLTDTLDRVASIAGQIDTASSSLPDVVTQVQTLLATVNELPLDTLVASVAEAASGAEGFLASDAVRSLPESVAAVLAEAEGAASDLRTVTTQVRDSDAVASVLAALERSDSVAASLDRTLQDVPALIETLEGLVNEARALPLQALTERAVDLTGSVDAILASEGAQALPDQASAALADVGAIATELRAAAESLRDGGGIASLTAALARTDSIAASLETSAAQFPGLLDQVEGLTADARALPLSDLTASAAEAAAALEAILATDGARALPAQLQATLAEAERTTANLTRLTGAFEDSGALDTLTAALNRTDRIAQSVETTTADLPQLLARIDAVAAEAQGLPLDALVTSANDLVQTANGLLASDEVGDIPPALASALAELGAVLADLREGGAVANTNAALASASDAADAIAAAAQALPTLANDLDALIGQAETLIGNYGARSQFNAQTLATLQDLRDTARAVTSLARTIERKPNALLIGR